jgi:hypothetical protein
MNTVCIMNKLGYNFLFLFIGFTALGQVTIPTAHMPTIGDVFTYGVDTQTYPIKSPLSGLYDFSELRQNDTTTFRYIANDKIVEYPNSNLKLIEDDNDNATVYFNKNGNDLFLISLSQIQSQLPIPGVGGLKGTMKYLSLPLTNTTNITTTDAINITIPKEFFQGFNIDSLISATVPNSRADSFVVSIAFSLNMKADGTGKIKTPIDNNIDVIRVIRKITIDYKILLYGRLLGFPANGSDVTPFIGGLLPIDDLDLNLTTHAFYSPIYRQEILMATLDTTGTKYQGINYRYRTKNGVIVNQIQGSQAEDLDIVQTQNRIEVRNIPLQTSALLSLYSLDGKKITEKKLTTSDYSLVLDKVSGIVIAHLNAGGKISTKKISIQ